MTQTKSPFPPSMLEGVSADQLATATGGQLHDPPPLRQRPVRNAAKDEYKRRHLLPWV